MHWITPSEKDASSTSREKRLEKLNEELETLNAPARDLEDTIATNVAEILEA